MLQDDGFKFPSDSAQKSLSCGRSVTAVVQRDIIKAFLIDLLDVLERCLSMHKVMAHNCCLEKVWDTLYIESGHAIIYHHLERFPCKQHLDWCQSHLFPCDCWNSSEERICLQREYWCFTTTTRVVRQQWKSGGGLQLATWGIPIMWLICWPLAIAMESGSLLSWLVEVNFAKSYFSK